MKSKKSLTSSIQKTGIEKASQPDKSLLLAETAEKLNLAKTKKQIAVILSEICDIMIGWDAFMLVLFERETNLISSCLNIDIIKGSRREVKSDQARNRCSRILRKTIREGPQLILRKTTKGDLTLNPFGDKKRRSASLMYAPLIYQKRVIAFVSIQSYKYNAYKKSDLKQLAALANFCSASLARIVAEEELKIKVRHISTINEAAKKAIEIERPIDYAKFIINLLSKVMKLEAFTLTHYVPESEKLEVICWADIIDGNFVIYEPPERRYSSFNSKGDKFFKNSKPKMILRKPGREIKTTLIPFGNKQKAASLLFAPIKTKTNVKGIISVQSYEYYAYTNADIELLADIAYVIGESLSRMKAEAAKTEAEDIYRKAISFAEGVPYNLDYRTMKYTFIGDGIETLTGYTAEEMKEYGFERIVIKTLLTGEISGMDIRRAEKLAIEGRLQRWVADYLIKTKNGERRWISDSSVQIKDSDGKGYQSIGILQNITDRKRAEVELQITLNELEKRVEERTKELSISNQLLTKEIEENKKAQEALHRSEAIYKEAIETAHGVPYKRYFDSQNYDFMGNGIEELLGVPLEGITVSVIEKLTKEIYIADPDATSDIYQYARDFKDGKVDQYRVDLLFETAGSEEKWVSDSSVPIIDEKTGKVIGALGILQDITSRKKMEETARRQQEHLVQTEKLISLGTLVSGVAHEINNPNNFILSNSSLIMDVWKSISPILEKYFKENGDFSLGGVSYTKMKSRILDIIRGITHGSERIKEIVNELRDFVKPGNYDDISDVDINEVIKSAVMLLENMIKKTTRNFSVTYKENIPVILGNFNRLEQVVINILQNACEALDNYNKGISITTDYDTAEEGIIVKIKDEGVGIKKEDSRYIIDPFFTTKRESGGTGLGLSISSKIIDEHNGLLLFNSDVGVGTTITIKLPVRKPVKNKGK